MSRLYFRKGLGLNGLRCEKSLQFVGFVVWFAGKFDVFRIIWSNTCMFSEVIHINSVMDCLAFAGVVSIVMVISVSCAIVNWFRAPSWCRSVCECNHINRPASSYG